MIASSFCVLGSQVPVEEKIHYTKMMDSKRSLCSVDPSSLSLIASKRHKPNSPISTKERKEKIGERIVALQQLVSPYGKTDTASVLLEVMEYIQFLHEQVKVLSAPYLQSSSTVRMQESELYHYSLRSRGLCLVPIECTVGVAGSNGADIWAPIKSSSSNFEKAISELDRQNHKIRYSSSSSQKTVVEIENCDSR